MMANKPDPLTVNPLDPRWKTITLDDDDEFKFPELWSRTSVSSTSIPTSNVLIFLYRQEVEHCPNMSPKVKRRPMNPLRPNQLYQIQIHIQGLIHVHGVNQLQSQLFWMTKMTQKMTRILTITITTTMGYKIKQV